MGAICRTDGNLHGLFAATVAVAGGSGVAISGEDRGSGRRVVGISEEV